MPPRSPLPQRFGLDAAWLRTTDGVPGGAPEWRLVRDWLHARVGMHIDVDDFIAQGRFVYQAGDPVQPQDPYRHNLFVWFHRDLAPETPVPGQIRIVHHDERLVVIDKPAFLSTIPRGKHVQESVVVRLRNALGLPELTPIHRLDRVTSGLLVLTTDRRWRGPYQSMFQRAGAIEKTYHAVAPIDPALPLPVEIENHLAKEHGVMHAEIVPGAPVNARSGIALERELTAAEAANARSYDTPSEACGEASPGVARPLGLYRLTPHTGRTHQLRLHMWAAGVPIVGDPLYPVDRGAAIDDFTTPLQLLASRLSFTDPVSGAARSFASGLAMPLAP
ncbi:pseudouridine synthase [Leucobacter sp. HY1908]